jgi:type IX secretion system PorP/SprF family membrane protein
MRYILVNILVLFLLRDSVAQQPAQYSLYMLNRYVYNPAYAGLQNTLIASVAYRNQWPGFPGNPVSQVVNAHMPLYIAGGGVGMTLENESIGSWKQTSGLLTFNIQKEVLNGVFSAGVSAGLLQKQIDGSKVRTPGTIFDDLGNPVNHQDALLTTSVESGLGPFFHTGFYYMGEKLEVGVSALNLLENQIDMGPIKFRPRRTFTLMGNYRFDVGKKITAQPSLLVKSDISQTQMEFSLLTTFNENIFAGASFRGYHSESLDAVAFLTGFRLNEKLMLFYAYDLTLSNLNQVSSGSHELLLVYNLGKAIGKGIPPKIIYNTRSL